MEAHRSGPFKQQNKRHKAGRHRTKGQIDSETKGRSTVKALSRRSKHQLSRHERRHQSKQIRKHKRELVLAEKRSLGSATSPPFLTAIVSLCEDDNPAAGMLRSLSLSDPEAIVTTSDRDVTYLSVPRFKSRFGFVIPSANNLCEILDVLKVADTLVLIWPTDAELSRECETLLSCIAGQGLPATIHTVMGMDKLSAKQKEHTRKSLHKLLDKWSFEQKILPADSASDGLIVLRQIGAGKKRPLTLQKRRPHILVESMQKTDEGDSSVLQVCGYVRGPSLDVNSLIHIPGWGDFQMNQIDLLPDPHPLSKKSASMEEGERLLAVADPKLRTDLQSEVVPDPMEGEQTWPTPEELQSAGRSEKEKTKRVPKGTSEYQAAWILDEEETGDEDDDEETNSEESSLGDAEMPENPVEDVDSVADQSENDDEMEETESMAISSQVDQADFDEQMEKANLELYRKERQNEQFPDEMDTPYDTAARIRFQKYRGLKSFRTSPWDSKENLPYDYARIFQFENFKRTAKRVLKEERHGAQHGWFVRIHIKNVPNELTQQQEHPVPLVLYGLLPHEHKISLINLVVRKHPSCPVTIKAKERLIFHVGYRRFAAGAIFSQHTNGDKHKLERFLPTSPTVMSLYAPIIFPPSSVLVFREDSKGAQRLVATGAVLDVNPDRVVTKRLVLSGHPYKINKKAAVVRYMFFSRDDIMWFKPVELRTKYGRHGHIREPVGTHGHMKCSFDGQLTSQDTVLLNLYKRVYPKWSYESVVDLQNVQFRNLSSAPSTEIVMTDDD